jgi:hypothetical protein
MRRFLVIAVVLVWCAPAQAAPRTVARVGEFTLQARESGRRLCVTLRRSRHYQGEECGRIPRSPHRVLRIFPDIGFDNYAVAVPASVRVAETEDRRGRKARHRTFAARGFSARFVLIPAPPKAVFVRFYGPDGTLLGIDGGPAGYIDFDHDLTQIYGERRDGVSAHTEPRIDPSPDQADRIRTLACVDVDNSSGGSGFCDSDSENGLVVMGSCDSPDLAGGIVAPGVTGVRLTLGTGAQVTLPAVDLPAAFGGRRAFGAPVPSGEAVRDAAALDAAGTEVARTTVGLAPGGQPCAGPDGGNDRFDGPLVPVSPPAGAVAVAPGLLVADQGETLCVGIAALEAGLCPAPPADSDDPHLLRSGETVGGALSRDAARVTLELDRGPDLTVPTIDGAAYAGRWAGKVRFFTARVRAGREVTGAIVRDAGGTIIGTKPHGIPRARVRRRTVLAERDGLRLVREAPCFAAEVPDAPRFCFEPNPRTPIDGPFHQYRGAVTVACAPRLAMAYGRVPDKAATPQVLLDGAPAIRARRIRLAGDDAWVAFLPDVAVKGFRAGTSGVPLGLPPASRQCGYSAARAF